jgi:hypothetical protein
MAEDTVTTWRHGDEILTRDMALIATSGDGAGWFLRDATRQEAPGLQLSARAAERWLTRHGHDGRAEFFYTYAGWSHDPKTETAEQGRRRCALGLADAELHALKRGWWVATEDDPDVMEDDVDSVGMVQRGEAVNLSMLLYGPPDGAGTLADAEPVVLGALGGIVVASADDPYLRVVAAELASEATRPARAGVTDGED